MEFSQSQVKLICEFAEWLEEFAATTIGLKKERKEIKYSWSVPRKTKNGNWYSNWTTELLWEEFLKWKGGTNEMGKT